MKPVEVTGVGLKKEKESLPPIHIMATKDDLSEYNLKFTMEEMGLEQTENRYRDLFRSPVMRANSALAKYCSQKIK